MLAAPPRWAVEYLLIDGTTEPLQMYQCNPEYARSDANMEIRVAKHVSIDEVKSEYNQPIIWGRDCEHVYMLGYGGNAAAHKGRVLFVVERTPNFPLANLVDGAHAEGYSVLVSYQRFYRSGSLEQSSM